MGKLFYGKGEVGDLKGEFSRALEDFFGNAEKPNMETGFYPAVDVFEDEENVMVEVEAAGVEKENVNISFDNGVLSINGEKKSRELDCDVLFHRIERNYGKFHRNIAIPYEIDIKNIFAEAKNGVIKIVLPKKINSEKFKINVIFKE